MSVNLQFVFVCVGFCTVIPAAGQIVSQDGQGGVGFNRAVYEWQLRALNEPALQQPAAVSTGPGIVSADVLRHPLSSKARHELELAEHQIDLGNHWGAVEGLQRTLIKYPASAPYAYNLLGREYIESREYVKAKESFAEAARLMPHESAPHSNLGLSLAILGQWDRAEQEIREALHLDRANQTAKQILEMMKLWKLGKTADPKTNIASTP